LEPVGLEAQAIKLQHQQPKEAILFFLVLLLQVAAVVGEIQQAPQVVQVVVAALMLRVMVGLVIKAGILHLRVTMAVKDMM
jgi:hypothetical protein